MRSDHWEIHFHPKQMLFAWFTRVKVQVKESHYKTRQILRVPGGWSFQISRQSAQEGAKVSPTHRPPLPPGNIPGTVRGWLSLWAILRPEGLCQWKIPVTPSGIEPATFRPQLTAPPRTPEISIVLHKKFTTYTLTLWRLTTTIVVIPHR